MYETEYRLTVNCHWTSCDVTFDVFRTLSYVLNNRLVVRVNINACDWIVGSEVTPIFVKVQNLFDDEVCRVSS